MKANDFPGLGGRDLTEHGVVLYLDGISVSFDGFKALNNLSLAIDAGELRCVIGPNGAGKTTMMDVITGKTRPDDGDVFFEGVFDLSRLDETEIAELHYFQITGTSTVTCASFPSRRKSTWMGKSRMGST